MNGYFGNGSGNNQVSSSPDPGSGDLINVSRLISLILRFKWLIALSAILFGSGAYYLAYHHLLPVYSSSAKLVIEKQNAMPAGDAELMNQLISQSSSFNFGNSRASDIEFLTSGDLLSRVADQLVNILSDADISQFPILWSNYPEDSTRVTAEKVASRLKGGLNITEHRFADNMINVSFSSYSPQEASRIVNLFLNIALEVSKEDRRTSAREAREFIQREKSRVRANLDQAEDRLSRYMNEKDLVALDNQATNLVNSYSELQNERQSIDIQLQSINTEISNLEQRVESIRPGLSQQFSQALGPTITSLQQRLAEKRTERFVIISNNPHLKENPSSEPRIRRLDNEISELQDEIGKLTDKLFKDEGGSLENFRSSDGNIAEEIQNIQIQLTQLRIQKNQLEAQAGILDDRIEEARLFLDQVPEYQVQLARLQREVAGLENMFMMLSEQEADVALLEQTIGSMGKVMEYASPSGSPVSPRKTIMLVGGLWLGIILPIGLIYLLDVVSNKIRSVDDLKAKNHPVLSVVYDHDLLPKNRKMLNKNKSKVTSIEGKKVPEKLTFTAFSDSPDAESYRRLVNNLLFTDPDHAPKSILVTSSAQGEGKTTIAVNLASALAETGKRVLLVDGDLRRPNVHRFFEKPAAPGIMQILFEEKEYKYKEFVQKTVVPNLYIITSGGVAPNPASVTSSEKFRKLVADLEEMVDFIIIDTPPYGVISDIAPLLKMMDGVLLTVRFNQTKLSQLDYTLEQLHKVKANLLGFVLNKYNVKKSADGQETKKLYSNLYSNYYDYHKTRETVKG